MERCCCGAHLRDTRVQIVTSPCTCPPETRGPGRSFTRVTSPIPTGITEQHYNERKAMGAPLMTDAERGAFVDKTWV